MDTEKSRPTLIFYLLVAIGIVISVLTELEKISPAIRELCGGDTGGCVAVGKSKYSSFFGIPLGYWGVASYIAWILLYMKRRVFAGLFGAFLLGAEFYFVYLQFYVIEAVCPLCMSQFVVVFLLNLLLIFTVYTNDKERKLRVVSLPLLIVSFLLFFVPMKMDAGKMISNVESVTSWGDPTSEYMIELFSDYQCIHCQRFEPALKRVMKEYPEIYILFHDYILPSSRYTPTAIAYAGSVAYFEGREEYLKTRFEIFENQKEISRYLNDHTKTMKRGEGMEEAITKKLKDDLNRAEFLGVNATPTIALLKNGKVVKMIRGGVLFETLRRDLDSLTGRR